MPSHIEQTGALALFAALLLAPAVAPAAASAAEPVGAPRPASSTTSAAPTGGAVCAVRAAAATRLRRLDEALAHGRFITYHPTSLQVWDGRVTPAQPESIRDDLRVLRERFDALITYGALNGAEAIPGIAAQLGFRALVIGVWDPFDAREIDAALAAARAYPDLVVGIALGNERVLAGRTGFPALVGVVRNVRARLPAVPLTVTEPFHLYYDAPARELLSELDFLLPNVHPVHQPWWRDAPDTAGADFVVGVVRELRVRYCGAVLVKETGVPTAPEQSGYTEARQASFYRALRAAFPPRRDAAFAYFSAFDAPWRVYDEQAVAGHHPEEAHWGLYDEERRAKRAAAEVPALQPRSASPRIGGSHAAASSTSGARRPQSSP
jgi:exo-beta-1,3-glucanase (GH17 family)